MPLFVVIMLSGGFGASTMQAVISVTTLTVALGLFLVGHFHLTRLLELLPY